MEKWKENEREAGRVGQREEERERKERREVEARRDEELERRCINITYSLLSNLKIDTQL